jgi:hypothetical protein
LIFVVANANTPLGSTAAVVFRILGVAGFILLLVARRRARDGPRSRLADDPGAAPNLFSRRYWQVVTAEAALLAIGSSPSGPRVRHRRPTSPGQP